MKNIVVCTLSIIAMLCMTCAGSEENRAGGTETNSLAETDSLIIDNYKNRSSIDHRREIVFTYITSPGCSLCTRANNINTVIEIKNKLSEKVDSLDAGFLTMGVVVGWDVNVGYEHLNYFGNFDEILIGNNWFGTGGLKYLFEDIPGRPGVPQIVVTKRIYDADESDDGYVRNFRGIESEELLVRHIGVNRLEAWFSDGLPLPDF